MTDFLRNYFRYHTMNSWNRSTSYACNLKITHLGLDSITLNKCKVHQQLIRCCGQDTVLMGLHQLRNSYAMCSDLLFILSDFRVQPGILSLERRAAGGQPTTNLR